MGELIGIIVILALTYVAVKSPEKKFDNYMPPQGYKIDYNAQSLDRVSNHLSKEEVMRNTVNGKYNVKKEY